MARAWKWPAAVLGLVVGAAVLALYAYVFLDISGTALAASWLGLIYVGPVVVDVVILVAAVFFSRGSTQFRWVLVRNLLLGVWFANILTLTYAAVLATRGLWPIV